MASAAVQRHEPSSSLWSVPSSMMRPAPSHQGV
jgi:hypothetical protein